MLTNINNLPDYQNIGIVKKNCLAPRSYFIPFKGFDEARKTSKQHQSSCCVSLSGSWKFRFYKSPMEIEDEALGGNPNLEWNTIPVPSCWQNHGYEIPFYVNNDFTCPAVPDKIPNFNNCGLYTLDYELEKKYIAKRKIISFLGVSSGFTLYVNNTEVGYAEGSHNISEFDLSEQLNVGKNNITVLVYKWTSGSFLESQDMFRYNGIFRDVFLTFSEQDYIFDFKFITAEVDGGFNCKLTTDVKAKKFNLKCSVFDSLNREYLSFDSKGESEFFAPSPQLWTAETPYVYVLYISLYVDGKELECVKHLVGFKTIDANNRVFKVNGVPIKIKGVNHHDSSPSSGYTVSYEQNLQDLKLIKGLNCNTVRFSHYPPHPEMLNMCDELGLYVIDESDLESYGSMNFDINYFGNSKAYSAAFLNRTQCMYMRDKNHPCVIMWSLGNEAGTGKNFDLCNDYIKANDTQIPVHYETSFREYKDGEKCGYDIVSMMYSDLEFIKNWTKKNDKRPFFLCEFAHSMGLSPGGLKDYIDLMYSEENFIGGCIWEFCDHAVTNDSARHKYVYGGEHGEYIHDNNFCCDGLFLPDRTPSGGAYEAMCAFRPLLMRNLAINNGHIRFKIFNSQSFVSSANLKVVLRVLDCGKEIFRCDLKTDIAPLNEMEYEIKIPEKLSDAVLSMLTYKEEKLIASEESVLIKADCLLPKNAIGSPLEFKENKNNIKLSNGENEIVFNKLTCTVDSIKIGVREAVNQQPKNNGYTFYSGAVKGFIPSIWHAPTDNEMYIKNEWFKNGFNMMWTSFYKLDIFKDDKIRIVAEGVFSPPKYGLKFIIKVEYVFFSDLSFSVNCSFTACEENLPCIPHIAMFIEMPCNFQNIEYYGLGERENYPDYRLSALTGIYRTTVDKMHTYYIRPQENGNRGDIRYFSVTDNDGTGLKFSALGDLINFTAKPYTTSSLEKARHEEDIEKDTVQVFIKGFAGGVGSNSCGPLPFKEYRLEMKKGETKKYGFYVQLLNGVK